LPKAKCFAFATGTATSTKSIESAYSVKKIVIAVDVVAVVRKTNYCC